MTVTSQILAGRVRGFYPAPPELFGSISIGSTRLGQILVDGKGRTLYLFAADSGTRSTCNSGACVQYWPPVLTKGARNPAKA